MKHFATLAAFAASANALVGRTDSCCFKLTASGGASGSLGQLDDGQNRVGDSSLPPATYCIDNTGSITDSNGRGCILTPPTTQLQCDQGASPTPGFSISSSGKLQYQGSSSFVACETGMNGGMNIYTTNSSSVTQCTGVTLMADSCSGSGAGAGPSGAAPSGPSSAPGAGASSSRVPVISPSSGAPSVGPSGHASSGVPSGPSGAPGVGPSGPASSAPGVSSSVVSVATPGSSAPASSGPAGPGGAGVVRTTVHTTQTITSCPESSTQAPVGPGGGAGASGTPSVPGAGVGPSGSPSGPGAGAHPSGTSSVPGGGAHPSGAPSSSVPGGGAHPSGAPSSSVPGGGVSPSGAPSGPGGGVGPSATPSGAQPSGTQGAGASCPTDLSGNYEYPHLIIPVDSSSPSKAPGTSFNGTVTDTVSSIFNFDIPNSDSGKTCSLVFLFPHLQDLETSSFSFSGNGKIDFAQLDSPAKSSTSYNNRPHVKQDFGDFTVSPGNSYLISTFKCPAGQTVAYEMKNAGSTNLDFFEDYNPSPLGLYVTVC